MVSLSAALLIVTASAQLDPAALGQAANRASEAYRQCQLGETAKLDATVSPAAAAKTIVNACAAQREVMHKARNEFNSAMFAPDVAAAMRADAEAIVSEPVIATDIHLDRANKVNQQCINGEIAKLAPTVASEAGATTVFDACTAQRDAMLKAWVARIELSPLKDEWTIALIRHYEAASKDEKEIALAKAEIADAIRRQRGPGAAPAR